MFSSRRKERPSSWAIQPVVIDAPDLLWSDSLGGRAAHDVSPEERVRQEAIHELRKTEITFVESLREIETVRLRCARPLAHSKALTLSFSLALSRSLSLSLALSALSRAQSYVRPLRLAKFISTQECDAIFANFDEITHLHKDFLEVRRKPSNAAVRDTGTWIQPVKPQLLSSRAALSAALRPASPVVLWPCALTRPRTGAGASPARGAAGDHRHWRPAALLCTTARLSLACLRS